MVDSEDELLLLSYVYHRRNLIRQRKRSRAKETDDSACKLTNDNTMHTI